MHRLMRPVAIAGLFVLLAASVAGAQVHENGRWGFKIKAPSGWKPVPQNTNERWIAEKFLSKRAYVGEASIAVKPEMRVIVFPHSRTKRATNNPDADKKKPKKKDDDGKVEFRNYRNYRDYLKKTFSGGGYFFTTEEAGEHAGVAVEMLEANVDKNTRYGKQRIIAWVFKLQDCDVAVDFVVFEKSYKGLKSKCYRALRSFKLIDRDPNASTEDEESTEYTRKAESELSPAERMRYRRDRVEKMIRKIEETLPDGWKTSRSAHFFVVSNASKKYTKRIVNQAEAIRNWLDSNLADIGDDYVPTAVLRVCKTDDDAAAYAKGSGDAFDMVVREIVVSERTWDRRWEMERVATGVVGTWFRQKNEELVDDLPPWIRYGIRQFVGTGIAKGKRLVFKPDKWEKQSLRTGERENKILDCKAIIQMTFEDYAKASRKAGATLTAQSGSLARYLFSNRAQSNKKTKDIVIRYFEHLGEVVREQLAKDKKKKKGRKMADTEEEELEQAKARKAAAKKRARHVVDETFRRTFADWSDSDWKKLHASWKRASL